MNFDDSVLLLLICMQQVIIGATTAEKLEGTACGMDVDSHPFPSCCCRYFFTTVVFTAFTVFLHLFHAQCKSRSLRCGLMKSSRASEVMRRVQQSVTVRKVGGSAKLGPVTAGWS